MGLDEPASWLQAPPGLEEAGLAIEAALRRLPEEQREVVDRFESFLRRFHPKPARLEDRTMTPFDDVVTSEQDLRAIIGVPGARAVQKERSVLDGHCRAFIACSPFLLMATAGANGRCDVSPKGDAPGFVQVLDDRRLVIPERPGNKRLDGMLNLLANPHVGLIFMVPGREETLRVNGRAWITRNAALLARSTVQGKAPLLAIGVEVEQTFMHCAKAFRRSHLWKHEEWPGADVLPSMACVLFDQIRPEGVTLQEYERDIEESYAKRLY